MVSSPCSTISWSSTSTSRRGVRGAGCDTSMPPSLRGSAGHSPDITRSSTHQGECLGGMYRSDEQITSDQTPNRKAAPMQPLIVPSVLPADFARLGDEVAELCEAGVDRIQWDVMDGVFVPNLTFGPDVIAAARPHSTVGFEAHLMVVNPDELLGRYIDAGCELVIVHAEACTHLHRTLA